MPHTLCTQSETGHHAPHQAEEQAGPPVSDPDVALIAHSQNLKRFLQATAKLEELDHAHQGKARFPTLSDKRVLAFAPDVLPLHLDDEKDFRAAVMGFVQVHHPPQTTIALW